MIKKNLILRTYNVSKAHIVFMELKQMISINSDSLITFLINAKLGLIANQA